MQSHFTVVTLLSVIFFFKPCCSSIESVQNCCKCKQCKCERSTSALESNDCQPLDLKSHAFWLHEYFCSYTNKQQSSGNDCVLFEGCVVSMNQSFVKQLIK